MARMQYCSLESRILFSNPICQTKPKSLLSAYAKTRLGGDQGKKYHTSIVSSVESIFYFGK